MNNKHCMFCALFQIAVCVIKVKNIRSNPANGVRKHKQISDDC